MIDTRDEEILSIIQEEGRISNADVARRVGMAPSAVHGRLRKLEARGVIQGYEALVDPKAVGRDLTAFTFVSVEEQVGSTAIGEALTAVPGVLEVHYTAGQDNYLVKLRVGGTEGLKEVLGRFGAVPGVRDTKTTIVLSTLKESRKLPLNGAAASSSKENGHE